MENDLKSDIKRLWDDNQNVNYLFSKAWFADSEGEQILLLLEVGERIDGIRSRIEQLLKDHANKG